MRFPRATWLAIVLAAATLYASSSSTRGAALFTGLEPITGRLEGHAEAMPAEAVVCANCHNGANIPALEAGGSNTAPALNATTLLRPVARRGGPGSVYNQASFCQALRTGIDPAFVVLRRSMPRFELEDAQCASLWDYLTQPGSTP